MGLEELAAVVVRMDSMQRQHGADVLVAKRRSQQLEERVDGLQLALKEQRGVLQQELAEFQDVLRDTEKQLLGRCCQAVIGSENMTTHVTALVDQQLRSPIPEINSVDRYQEELSRQVKVIVDEQLGMLLPELHSLDRFREEFSEAQAEMKASSHNAAPNGVYKNQLHEGDVGRCRITDVFQAAIAAGIDVENGVNGDADRLDAVLRDLQAACLHAAESIANAAKRSLECLDGTGCADDCQDSLELRRPAD